MWILFSLWSRALTFFTANTPKHTICCWRVSSLMRRIRFFPSHLLLDVCSNFQVIVVSQQYKISFVASAVTVVHINIYIYKHLCACVLCSPPALSFTSPFIILLPLPSRRSLSVQEQQRLPHSIPASVMLCLCQGKGQREPCPDMDRAALIRMFEVKVLLCLCHNEIVPQTCSSCSPAGLAVWKNQEPVGCSRIDGNVWLGGIG